MKKRGYLEGSEMATTFNMLRANDLIWSFVVNNYLLGNEPFPFDLLYWNSDSTRMPARDAQLLPAQMYQENLLAAGRRDHARRRSRSTSADQDARLLPVDAGGPHRAVEITYRGTQLLGGEKRFVLAASGHIAGVVNPPDRGEIQPLDQHRPAARRRGWFLGATEMSGSWWPDWQRWITALGKSRCRRASRATASFRAIERAPGSYVAVRLS